MQSSLSSPMTTKTEGLLPILEKIGSTKILVIGDLMLDKFIWGDVTRISPEAPVPVVHVKNETCAPGGAANAAMNVCALGAKCYLLGLVGDDYAKDILITLLNAKNIDTQGIFVHQNPTIQKVRVMGNNHNLIRFDYEEKTENEKEKEMIEYIKQIANEIDIILVSDYAKGTITQTIMLELKKIGKKIIVDPKSERFHFYKGVYAIKPNEKEATEIANMKNTGEESINQMGKQMLERSNANILLSRGKEGMSLFELEGDISHFPARTKEVFDVTGAGDTVVATIALAIAAGANLKEATMLANYAAGIKVSKIGTVAVSKQELQNTLKENSSKIKTKKELREVVEELKQKNKKIAFTNGCFDILHIGHTRLFKEAKTLSDVLILALDSDESVRRIKGEGRPLIAQQQRAEILCALETVDYVTFFEHEEIKQLLDEIKPDFFIKGEPHTKEELDVVEHYGGKPVIINFENEALTTKIIEKLNLP